MPPVRQAKELQLRSFAKLNLDLRVLHKRPDNYHELRTVFQTISLHDTIGIRFESARRTQVSIADSLDIPNNLILRAAQAILDATKRTARINFQLTKRIPMGAGLGGGSSNAAAILLALPPLLGAKLNLDQLTALGAQLGSDVPFFLYGGAALGFGRGTELYPLPDLPSIKGLVVAPGIHVSTPDAYRDLAREYEPSPATGQPAASPTRSNETLTTTARGNDTKTFRSVVWSLAGRDPESGWKSHCMNDFEEVVFSRHPVLRSIVKLLAREGARPARMTGSGSALFGLFDNSESFERAFGSLSRKGGGDWSVSKITLLARRRYQSIWRRQLGALISPESIWPPVSRPLKP